MILKQILLKTFRWMLVPSSSMIWESRS